MKKIILILIAISIPMVAFAKKAKSQEETQVVQEEEASQEEEEQETEAEADTEKSFGDKIKGFGKTIGNGIKSGAEKTGDAINSKKPLKVIGRLTVSEEEDIFSFSLTCEDGTTYILKISDSEDKALKLSGYKDRNISVSGILNKDKNEIRVTSYKLATEEKKEEDADEYEVETDD